MPAPAECLVRLTRAPVAAVGMALALSLAGCADDAATPAGPSAPAASTATVVAPLVFRAVSAGDTHTCGVTRDNRAWCWGHNFTGQLGDGTTTDHPVPAPVAGGLSFRTVSVGNDHSCGVTTDDRAYCWGYGAVGDGNAFATIRREPVVVAGGHRFAQVQAGIGHTCGITTAGIGLCWGSNGFGQLGNYTRVTQLTPVTVGGGLRWRWINPGGLHTCGVTTDSRAYCWGRNNEGQLGGGTTLLSRGFPIAVSGGLAFRNVSAGDFHTCGVTTADRAYCWGSGTSGTLGDGTEERRLVPVPVASPK
jgi:hypothetical protein